MLNHGGDLSDGTKNIKAHLMVLFIKDRLVVLIKEGSKDGNTNLGTYEDLLLSDGINNKNHVCIEDGNTACITAFDHYSYIITYFSSLIYETPSLYVLSCLRLLTNFLDNIGNLILDTINM